MDSRIAQNTGYITACPGIETFIDAVFSKKAIDWNLIRMDLPDLLRIALSIKEGRILPSTILRTIRAGNSKMAQAGHELGCAGFLLRFMAEVDSANDDPQGDQ